MANATTSPAGWTAQVPGLEHLEDEARALLVARTRIVHMPRGGHAFEPDTECSAYLVVLEGSVRVQLIAESGREIVLYRVRRGESCVLTTSCLLTRQRYSAAAVAEDDVTAAALQAETFRTLLATSATFRDFVLSSYAERVSDLIMAMEDAIFHRLESRLARVLLAAQSDTVAATHQTLAVELGSAREVVSRQLKLLEKQGLVSLGRGRITLIDRTRLARIAAEPA